MRPWQRWGSPRLGKARASQRGDVEGVCLDPKTGGQGAEVSHFVGSTLVYLFWFVLVLKPTPKRVPKNPVEYGTLTNHGPWQRTAKHMASEKGVFLRFGLS